MDSPTRHFLIYVLGAMSCSALALLLLLRPGGRAQRQPSADPVKALKNTWAIFMSRDVRVLSLTFCYVGKCRPDFKNISLIWFMVKYIIQSNGARFYAKRFRMCMIVKSNSESSLTLYLWKSQIKFWLQNSHSPFTSFSFTTSNVFHFG